MNTDKFRKARFVLFTLGCVLAGTSIVQASNAIQNNFLGSLFPPGFTPKINPSALHRQSTTKMRTPTDNSPIRNFARKVQANLHQSSTPMTQLGQQLFNDTHLSNPAGQSCASCHSAPEAFTFPGALVNAQSGIAPGAVAGRVGNRLPPSITYTAFSPPGPYYDPDLTAYAGGMFWDGRAVDFAGQAKQPFFNPNEQDNILHNVSDPALLAQEVASGPEAALFKQVFGQNAFNDPPATNLNRIAQAIAAFESTASFAPFTSRYDGYLAGKERLTSTEMAGLRLFTGSVTGRPGGAPNYKAGQCVLCHGIPSDPSTGPDVFSNFCYANIGVPKNPNNPFYNETNQGTNPLGYNPQGKNYIDLGLGDFIYPAAGLPSGNSGQGSNGQGDYLAINGAFKAPSLRNLDKRPYSTFPRRYFHNGAFTSLKDIVHFYNTRNLTTKPGEIIDFTQPNPYAGLVGKPLWPAPEFPSTVTLQNPSGLLGSPAGQVGNLGLTSQEEDEIVAFLKTLTDR